MTNAPREPLCVAEWKRWGASDPLFAVATIPGRERSGSQPWTPEEFYAHGKKEAAVFLAMWTQYLGAMPSGTLLEIGCGAGRLTHALADQFARVLALDVSEQMQALARERCPAHVEFLLTDGPRIPAPDACADGVFSYVVFQHFDGFEWIDSYLREAARVLRPRGTVMIHVPAPEPGAVWRQRLTGYHLRRALTSAAPFLLPRRLRVGMNYRMYEPEKVEASLSGAGLIEIRAEVMPESDRRGTFYFARKPGTSQ